MKITILTTGTNNVPPITDPLADLGHKLTYIVYDGMSDEDVRTLPRLVNRSKPDWVLYVGALPGHHQGTVPTVDTLAEIGAKHLMVHLCFDGAEHFWFPVLQEYYDRGRFALQVSIDGVRTGPIGDRGLVSLCPVDTTKYENPPWAERPLWLGFSGGLHAGRAELIGELARRGALAYRPRDEGDYSLYRKFLSSCRVGLNCASTGGIIGGAHVKHRCLEVAASGGLLLEERGSPLADWFVPGEDYLEYSGIDGVIEQMNWVHAHAEEAEAMEARMREKVVLDHSPAVFWSQVLERLGLGEPLRPPREVPWRFWLASPASASPSPYPWDQRPVPAAPQPVLIEQHAHHNLVAYQGQVYVVPMALGSLDLTNALHRGMEGIVVKRSLEEARHLMTAL